MSFLRLLLVTLFCVTCPILTLPTGHEIEKRSTVEEILGDLTAGQSGLLNSPEVNVPLGSCKALYDEGYNISGMYTISPGGARDFNVFCDMTVQGGGWTVIQRRISDVVSFNKLWNEYRDGFGAFEGNLWLGLEKIWSITESEPQELYVGLQSYSSLDEFAYAKYSTFSIDDEASKYKLTISGYSGTAGDSFDQHNGDKFSAIDQDNDLHTTCHCAEKYSTGWWYHDFCHDAHLNGIYYPSPGTLANTSIHDGITWQDWRGDKNSLKTVVMALRPT